MSYLTQTYLVDPSRAVVADPKDRRSHRRRPAVVRPRIPGLLVEVHGGHGVPAASARAVSAAFSVVFGRLPEEAQAALRAASSTYARLMVVVRDAARQDSRLWVGMAERKQTVVLLASGRDCQRQAALVYAAVVLYGRKSDDDRPWGIDDDPAALRLVQSWGL